MGDHVRVSDSVDENWPVLRPWRSYVSARSAPPTLAPVTLPPV